MLMKGKSFFIVFIISLVLFRMEMQAQWVERLSSDNRIQGLAAKGDTVFARFISEGLAKTTDNGGHWENIDFPFGYINSMIVVGNTIFASTTPGDLYRSSDDGKTWEKVNIELQDKSYGLSLFTDGKNLFANNFKDLLMSTNNGDDWKSIVENIYSIYSVVVDTDGIYLGTDGGKGVVRSTDFGNSWEQINNGLNSWASINSLYKLGQNLVLNNGFSIYHSSNNGASWELVLDSFGANSFTLFRNKIYACGNSSGVCVSSDSGKTWTILNDGLVTPYILGIVNNGENLFVGGHGGVSVLDTVDNKWKQANHQLPVSDTHISISSLAKEDDTIFAGTNRSGVVLSTDNGVSWQYGNNEMSRNNIYSLTAVNHTLFAGTNNGLFTSTDNGDSWNSSNTGFPDTAIYGFLTTDSLIMAFTHGAGIFISSDMGQSWNSVNSGLTNKYVYSMTKIGDKIYAGTKAGLYQSSLYTFNWSMAGTELSNKSVTALAVKDDYLLAGTDSSGLYYSTDFGENWSIGINKESPWLTHVPVLTIFVVDNWILISNALGIFKSYDNEFYWKGEDHRKSYVYNATQFIISRDTLVAGTIKNGLWTRPVSEVTNVEMLNSESIPSEFNLSQNYPNPFNPVTNIRFSISKQTNVKITVYNILGQSIQKLIDEKKSPGVYEVQFDGSHLASGIYFYRLETDNFSQTKKLLLLK